ncbi:MAG: FKBP-type peptidyl-prolyl cis-trans isomerase [Actinomycetia bacterium]|nr:FKBP-type peptidyl-prolyl cis-trans isomerase [Actinomycetes bacterium]
MKTRSRLSVVAVLVFVLAVALSGCTTKTETTRSDGLQIKDTLVGKGEKVKTGDVVTIDYTLWLYVNGAKGTKLGSSIDPTKGSQPSPLKLSADSTIKGLVEGVPGMRVGGTRTLIVPPALAYGNQAVGNGAVPANSTLYFEIKLVSIEKLDIKDTKVGTGAAVKTGDTVTVDYTGWLYVDGKKTTQFDTSKGKKPFQTQIGAGQVIPGWDMGIPGMKAGGTRTLIISPALAYGKQGSPPTIPANSTLYFEVTLVSIDPPPSVHGAQ